MANRSVLYELIVNLDTADWGVSVPLDQSLIGPMAYGWDRFQKDPNSLTFGGGLLAGSPLPGTRRMIFCGYSPQWEDFYVSALGGAMYVLRRLGVNYVWLRGRAAVDSVLILNLKDGEYSVRLEPIHADEIWRGYQDSTGRVWEGFYALQQAVFEKYKAEYEGDWLRVLAVGPAARHTKEGAIGSNAVKRGKISHIDDWAGRGGLGSRLLQHHRVAAIVFGGDWQDPVMKDGKELDQFFLERFEMKAIQADLMLSEKYRYVPKFMTGGTFGVNMHTADDRLLSFNYQSIYASEKARLDLHDSFVLDHYLKQFNEESIKPKNFDHCGEPCAVACKKFVGEYKKDYEPYAALGPLCGVFDQRAAERLNKFVDAMGLDSIQTGGTVAWLMELIADGLIPPQDFGLPEAGPRGFPLTPRPPLPTGEGEKLSQPESTIIGKAKSPLPTELLAKARELRRNATDAEQLLWELLRDRQLNGLKFRRQHVLPPYIVDFYCHDAALVIELDGEIHNEPEQARKDGERTQALEHLGLQVLRFWNHEVLEQTDSILQKIAIAASRDGNGRAGEARHTLPSPSGRGAGGEGLLPDKETFNLIEDSAHNADYALAVVKMILFSEQGAVFRKGLRAAAKELDARYGINSLHRAVFTAHGVEGCMVPNQYWTPGMFAPMPLMGKYFSFYENKFYAPRALGRKNAERFVYELYSENTGACRFHRKWTEDIIDEIITAHFLLPELDYWQMNFQLAKAIHDYQSARGGMWESERVVDMIFGFLQNWETDGLKEPELLEWLARFRADKWQTARDFWQELYAGMTEAFAQGFPEPTPTPKPTAKA